jgi:hypothetical protein
MYLTGYNIASITESFPENIWISNYKIKVIIRYLCIERSFGSTGIDPLIRFDGGYCFDDLEEMLVTK